MSQPPNPPAHLLQRISNSPRVADFINSFGNLRYQVKQYLSEAGFDFSDFSHILDLGCGVGRFMFSFQSELKPHQKLWGCDVFEECAIWCQQHIDFAEIAHSSINPPLPYQARQFDFIYALSVYTHMRLDFQFRWAWEVYRVLQPGGVLFVTVHGTSFFPIFCKKLQRDVKEYRLYSFGDEGLFAYVSFSGQAKDEGQIEIGSAHTPAFFDEQFSAFERVRHFPQSKLAGEQDLYILRKPIDGRTIERPIAAESKNRVEQLIWPVELRAEEFWQTVEFRFNLKGHRTFRVYPSIEPAGFYQVRCRLVLKAEDKVLASEQMPLNNSRAYDGTHFGVIKIEAPDHTGEVTLQLSAAIKGQPSTQGTVKLNWCFPNFI